MTKDENTLLAYVWEVALHVKDFSSITDEGVKIIKECFDTHKTPKECAEALDSLI